MPRRTDSSPRRGCVLALAAVLLVPLFPVSAYAHFAPVPIAVWGGFTPADVPCQRLISRTAAKCAITAWDASDACIRAQLDGDRCDMGATRNAIEQAHTTAATTIANACTHADFLTMGFPTLTDIDIDVDVFCQELQDAMVSAIYDPAMQGGVVHAVDPTTRACISATRDASVHLLRLAFRARRRVFDRIASRDLLPSQKFTLVKRSTAIIQRAQMLLQTRLQRECPTFASVYGRTPVVFLTLIANRADCLCGRSYVQDYIVCPDSVCGNGMQEHAEQCDDGNTVDGDGCSADCQHAGSS